MTTAGVESKQFSASRTINTYVSYIPGLIVVLVVAVIGIWISGYTGPWVSDMAIVILLGLLVKNTVGVPKVCQAGAKFSLQKLLRLGIILLGIKLSFIDIVRNGALSLIIVLVCMSAALLLVYQGSRMLGLSRRLAILIGVGTAVCGNSAIVATAPAIEAKDEDVSFAVATITIFGTLAVFLYPIIGHLAGFSQSFFGTWAGTAVNDTSQVTATAAAYGEQALKVATVAKLTRNTLMAPLVVLIGILYLRGVNREATDKEREARRVTFTKVIPWFVLGFLALAILNTIGLFSSDVVSSVYWASHFLIVMAVTGIGLSTGIRDLTKVGLKPFFLGLIVATLVSLLSLLLIYLLHI
ncbi:MAG: putative sulfate exporter family transporter [Candidatus Marsarchaeota archaeon]|nr:putative sulfate exporter family transporter [Candidatus Marsarchaeota archaeon]